MWFNLSGAPELKKTLNKIVSDRPVGVEWHTPSETRRLIGMMSNMHKQKLAEAKTPDALMVAADVVTAIISLLLRPLLAAVFVVLYYDAKARSGRDKDEQVP